MQILTRSAQRYAASTNQVTTDHITEVIKATAKDKDIQDLCVLAHAVPRIAKYVPGKTDHREKPKLARDS